MDYGFTSSPTRSPIQSYFASPHPIDSTSDSSSPDSPLDLHPLLFNHASMPVDMFTYASNAMSFYSPQPGRIPVEYTGSSTLHARDHRMRRAASTSTSSSKDKETSPNMHLRRRAQNRASQRAFRERKERHVKGLERQLNDMHEKHQDLLQSYTRQADEASEMNTRIQKLNAELTAVRTEQDHSFSELVIPDKFDAVPGSDILYTGPECYFDKAAGEMHLDITPSSLDDIL